MADEPNQTKVENQEQETKKGGDPPPERPGWLPEKFKSPEELAKAYGELEKKMGKGEHKKPADGPAFGQGTTQAADFSTPELIEKAGLKFEELASQWAEHGDFTEEQHAALRKADPFLGKKRLGELAEAWAYKWQKGTETVEKAWASAYEIAGGKDEFAALDEWIKENKPAAELAEINASLKRNPGLLPMFTRAMKAEYDAHIGASGSKPIITGGASKGVPGGAAKDAAEFKSLLDRARAGDEVAKKRVLATPDSKIWEWNNA